MAKVGVARRWQRRENQGRATEELRHARNGDGVAEKYNAKATYGNEAIGAAEICFEKQRQGIAGIRVAKAKKSNCNAKKFIYA